MMPEPTSPLAAFVSGPAPTAPGPLPSDFEAAIATRRAAREGAKDAPRPRPLASQPGFKQAYEVHDRIAHLPAPGGIAVLVIVLIVLLMVLVPVTSDGETRLQLLFGVIGGKKRVAAKAAIPTTPTAGAPIPGLPTDPYPPGYKPQTGSGPRLAFPTATFQAQVASILPPFNMWGGVI